MGNTGSAHNMHNESAESELNSYYTHQYLRRIKKNRNQSVPESWSSGRNIAECKVLPKPTENLKLRATTNGAILQAGGTISFRAKEQLEERLGLPVLENELNIKLQPMRRCHTLILDGQSDSLIQRKTRTSQAHFQRSQTLIHVGYNRTKPQEDIAIVSNFQDELKSRIQQTSKNIQQPTTLKVNKYNKKRKAPPAPTKGASSSDTNSTAQILSVEPKNLTQSKPRIYATNANKSSAPQQLQPTRNRISLPRTVNNVPFQRGSNVRKSANNLRPDQNPNNTINNSKLTYRREKSFDAVLLRQNGANNEKNIERNSMPNTNSREISTQHVAKKIEDVTDRKKQLTRQHATNIIVSTVPKSSSTNYRNEQNLIKKQKNLSERKSVLNDTHIGSFESATEKKSHDHDHGSNTKAGDEPVTQEKKAKSQQSRIPQLKRTFYFGMKVSNESVNSNDDLQNKFTHKTEDRLLEKDEIGLLNHSIEPEEEINDNGILVHVRPTLPRRQPETPSFSPAAAWRNLLEEQQLLQRERSNRKQIKSNNHVIESPIYLATNRTKTNLTLVSNWTPQQDLEDDDDDDDADDKDNNDNVVEERNKLGHKRQTSNILHKLDQKSQKRQSINPLHIFSLSLPRDVHLQCEMKTSVNSEIEQENNFKTANYYLVSGFNSLQKFKTHLGRNNDSRPTTKCICIPKAANKRNSYNLQTTFVGDSFSTDNTVHQSDCPLYRPNNFHNDNWFLHKSSLNVSTTNASTKTSDSNYLKSSAVYLQPKSLKNIYGGKHIVYLPGGQETLSNTLNPDSQKIAKQKQKTNVSSYKRQRQCQEMVRESLQDVTPIQNIDQSNLSIPEKNTHRFSFQSTVRVLEKRRLAEKLSKDAELQEAQRLHELEAMKRVEEDFQRKRAPEKANLRNQLRLHLKASAENEEYRSLPLNLNYKHNNHQQSQQQQQVSDLNNNIFCRAEPDGAVSPTLDFNDNLDNLKHSIEFESSLNPITSARPFDFDVNESESETQTLDLQCSAMPIENYLNTII